MNRIIAFVFILSFFYSGHCFGNDSLNQITNPNDLNNFISQGDKYKAENKLHEAFQSYQKAIQIEPENADAHLGIARVYARLREYDKAINEFEISIKLNPNIEISVLSYLIVIHLVKEDLTKLKDCLKRLREIDIYVYGVFQSQIVTARTYGIFETEDGFGIKIPQPATPSKAYYELSNNASEIVQNEGIEKVIELFRKFTNRTTVSMVDKAFAYHEIGGIYLQYGNPIQGIESLEKATEIFPDFLYWKQELATTLISTQLYTKAMTEIEKILKISPGNKFGLYAQGIVYNEFGMYDKAIMSWDDLKSRDQFVFALAEDSYERAKRNLSNEN